MLLEFLRDHNLKKGHESDFVPNGLFYVILIIEKSCISLSQCTSPEHTTIKFPHKTPKENKHVCDIIMGQPTGQSAIENNIYCMV